MDWFKNRTTEEILVFILAIIILIAVIIYFFGVAFFIFLVMLIVGIIVLWKIYEEVTQPLCYTVIMVTGCGVYYVFGLIGLIIYGFVIGGIIVLILFEQPTLLENLVYPKQQLGHGRMCPSCGRSIPMDATVCPYCGKDFRTVVHQKPYEATPEARVGAKPVKKVKEKSIETQTYNFYCMKCDKVLSKKQGKYSIDKFGMALCAYHQEQYKKGKIDEESVSLQIDKYFCTECNKRLSKEQYDYSTDKFGFPLCIKHQGKYKATPEAKMLYERLQMLGVNCELEKWDGYKHVDIAIVEAKLNIEIDGSHHITNPKQLDADIKRDEYSQQKGWHTIRIRNHDIRRDLYVVANSIAEVVAKRKNNKG